MSGILGVFGFGAACADARTVRAMLTGLTCRGTESEVRRGGEDRATLAVTRQPWELVDGFSGRVFVAVDGPLLVAADASLYYQRDLLRKLELAGANVCGPTASHLILAAYRAWGERCAEHLEGDFAFVLWDGDRQCVVCARDFGGKRPLFYAQLENSLAIASTVSALLAHPRCPRDFDLLAIGAATSGLFAVPSDTAYRAISQLPAGCTLVARSGKTHVAPHWTPPAVRESGGPKFEPAAEELRHLLEAAVGERLASQGPTSVWLSGGWDSTAVFGAGEQVLRERGFGEHLQPISISFPPGDVGREDELILAVAQHWGAVVRWLDIREIPLLDHPMSAAARRDQPFAHAFETGNRALATESHAAGARVALDGVGGDQLFQVSDVYLSDLLRTGRWHELTREWRLKRTGTAGFRNFFRWAVQPSLPHPLLQAAGALRGGRPLRGQLERPLPEWIDQGFLRRTGLKERERRHTPKRRGSSRAGYESEWYLSHPYFPRAFASVHEFALQHGVEVRSPLYDARIVDFAAARPRSERSAGGDTKRLLRRAMQGLLPDHVLAPRRFRTGSAEGYFARSLRVTCAPFLSQLIGSSMRLAELGVVEPSVLRRRWERYVQRGGGELGVNLFLTLQVEMWLRTHAPLAERAAVNHEAGGGNLDAVARAVSPHGQAARETHDVQEESWMAKAGNT